MITNATKLHRLGLGGVLVVLLLLAACGGPSGATETTPTVSAGPVAPAPVARAHEAVLAFLRDGAAECVPQTGVSWTIDTDSATGPAGFGVYRYSAGGCDMTIAYAEPAGDDTRYFVALGDTTTGFCWQAQVDSRGQILNTGEAAATVRAGNPPVLYCEAQGNTYQVRPREDGTLCGVCVFPDGSICQGWDYFHGTCAPGDVPPSEQ